MKNDWVLKDDDFAAAWHQCKAYTMTSPERGYALWSAVEHIASDDRPGVLVECGCWRGGSAMLMALACRNFGLSERMIYLFDTFEGMTDPGEEDVDIHGRTAADLMEQEVGKKGDSMMWAMAGLEEVKANIRSVGLDLEQFVVVKGDVCETLSKIRTGAISLLRLDTDFYDSTLEELEVLYPRLVSGGVMIIDDYGHWQGARKAVDHYFSTGNRRRPLLNAVDYTGRICVKPPVAPPPPAGRYDYVSGGMVDPDLLPAFPSLLVTDPSSVTWPWLRKVTPHLWRTDSRAKKPMIGVVSYDEAVVLHNLALPFRGLPALEIGCHLAWSSAHILAAGVSLDIIDPALGDAEHLAAVESSLAEAARRAPDSGPARLFAGFSPSIVDAVAALRGEKWSFAFIDGWHDGDAPARDVRAVLPHMADDALVAFHDLLCPSVAAAFNVLKLEGWETALFNTSQGMAAAWRGQVSPPVHVPDPNMPDGDFPV